VYVPIVVGVQLVVVVAGECIPTNRTRRIFGVVEPGDMYLKQPLAFLALGTRVSYALDKVADNSQTA
jgi:hypothetical protein